MLIYPYKSGNSQPTIPVKVVEKHPQWNTSFNIHKATSLSDSLEQKRLRPCS
jgi:hypothetical protein